MDLPGASSGGSGGGTSATDEPSGVDTTGGANSDGGGTSKADALLGLELSGAASSGSRAAMQLSVLLGDGAAAAPPPSPYFSAPLEVSVAPGSDASSSTAGSPRKHRLLPKSLTPRKPPSSIVAAELLRRHAYEIAASPRRSSRDTSAATLLDQFVDQLFHVEEAADLDLRYRVGGADVGGDAASRVLRQAFQQADENIIHLRAQYKTHRRIVLLRAGEPVAVAVAVAHPEPLHVLEVPMLGVGKGLRKQGHGSLLVAIAMQLAAQLGLGYLVISATAEAGQFWLRQGLHNHRDPRMSDACCAATRKLISSGRFHQSGESTVMSRPIATGGGAMADALRRIRRTALPAEEELDAREVARRAGYEDLTLGRQRSFLLGADGVTRHHVEPGAADELPVSKQRPLPKGCWRETPYSDLRAFSTPDDRGYGVRCRSHIAEQQIVVEVVGRWLSDEEFETIEYGKRTYIVSFEDDVLARKRANGDPLRYIDCRVHGNMMRLLNDCHEAPNCEIMIWPKPDPARGIEPTRMFLVARTDIPAGVELTWCYGDHYPRPWLGEDIDVPQASTPRPPPDSSPKDSTCVQHDPTRWPFPVIISPERLGWLLGEDGTITSRLARVVAARKAAPGKAVACKAAPSKVAPSKLAPCKSQPTSCQKNLLCVRPFRHRGMCKLDVPTPVPLSQPRPSGGAEEEARAVGPSPSMRASSRAGAVAQKARLDAEARFQAAPRVAETVVAAEEEEVMDGPSVEDEEEEEEVMDGPSVEDEEEEEEVMDGPSVEDEEEQEDEEDEKQEDEQEDEQEEEQEEEQEDEQEDEQEEEQEEEQGAGYYEEKQQFGGAADSSYSSCRRPRKPPVRLGPTADPRTRIIHNGNWRPLSTFRKKSSSQEEPRLGEPGGWRWNRAGQEGSQVEMDDLPCSRQEGEVASGVAWQPESDSDDSEQPEPVVREAGGYPLYLSKASSTGYKFVSFHKRRYRATVKSGGVPMFLGYFDSAVEAAVCVAGFLQFEPPGQEVEQEEEEEEGEEQEEQAQEQEQEQELEAEEEEEEEEPEEPEEEEEEEEQEQADEPEQEQDEEEQEEQQEEVGEEQLRLVLSNSSATGYKGVAYKERSDRYVANFKGRHVGCYATAIEAARAYAKALDAAEQEKQRRPNAQAEVAAAAAEAAEAAAESRLDFEPGLKIITEGDDGEEAAVVHEAGEAARKAEAAEGGVLVAARKADLRAFLLERVDMEDAERFVADIVADVHVSVIWRRGSPQVTYAATSGAWFAAAGTRFATFADVGRVCGIGSVPVAQRHPERANKKSSELSKLQPHAPVLPPSMATPLEVGQRVKAKWQGGSQWFLGRISTVHPPGEMASAAEARYDVDYDDGDQDLGVRRHLIKPIAAANDVLRQLASLQPQPPAAQPAASELISEKDGVRLHLNPSSKTGYKGVHHAGSRFIAQVWENGTTTTIGYADTVLDAAVMFTRYVDSSGQGQSSAPRPTTATEKPPAKRPSIVTEKDGVRLHLNPDSVTGYKGVSPNSGQTGFRVQVCENGQVKNIGRADNAIDAAVIYARHVGPPEASSLAPQPTMAAAKRHAEDLVTEKDGVRLHLNPSTATGYKGVSPYSASSGMTGFRVQVYENGQAKHIGRADNAVDAAVIYARHVGPPPPPDDSGAAEVTAKEGGEAPPPDDEGAEQSRKRKAPSDAASSSSAHASEDLQAGSSQDDADHGSSEDDAPSSSAAASSTAAADEPTFAVGDKVIFVKEGEYKDAIGHVVGVQNRFCQVRIESSGEAISVFGHNLLPQPAAAVFGHNQAASSSSSSATAAPPAKRPRAPAQPKGRKRKHGGGGSASANDGAVAALTAGMTEEEQLQALEEEELRAAIEASMTQPQVTGSADDNGGGVGGQDDGGGIGGHDDGTGVQGGS